MSQITFTIEDADLQDYIDTFGQGYSATIPNPGHDPEDPESSETIPNPVTKAEFAKKVSAEILAKKVELYRRQKAERELEVEKPVIT